MPCPTCIEAVKQGALALYELAHLHADELPPGNDWKLIADQLRDLARSLSLTQPTTNGQDRTP